MPHELDDTVGIPASQQDAAIVLHARKQVLASSPEEVGDPGPRCTCGAPIIRQAGADVCVAGCDILASAKSM